MKLAKEFILREIAGEAILVPTGKTSQEFNGMINLSSTAQFIWENLEKVNSFEELISAIINEFEVDEDTAAKDAGQFVAELVKYGFAEPTKEDHSW